MWKICEIGETCKGKYFTFMKKIQWTVWIPIKIAEFCPQKQQLKMFAHRVQNSGTVKNKYNLTLGQSRFHTASDTIFHHKKSVDQVRFSAISYP